MCFCQVAPFRGIDEAWRADHAEDGMTLEQLMVFTVSSDHARQEQVWDAIRDG